MESHRISTTNSVGFSLLPSELLEYIIFKLAIPDIFLLKAINKLTASVISDQDFIRDYNHKSSSTSWLFIYKKRWQHSPILHGFTSKCQKWFKISIAELLNAIVPPKEDLYFLTASGNYFLFALNTTQEVVCVNPMSRTVRKIPPSPLGPRGTSMWRRSGMKLLSCPHGSGHFQFLFADYFDNRPTLFEYSSCANKWRSIEAREQEGDFPSLGDHIFLSVANESHRSVLIYLGSQSKGPLIVRPRFNGHVEEERFVLGFSAGGEGDRLHVYGDGYMTIIRSNGCDSLKNRASVVKSVELWCLSSNGNSWELISKIPDGLIEKIKRPYGVIMGCLNQRNGITRAILMSNYEGIWDLVWLCYDTKDKIWTWVPLPDCKMKGVNMAGISFSSGLSLV